VILERPIVAVSKQKRVEQNKHVKAETKQTNKKLGFLGNNIMHARTGLCAHNQAFVRRQDYAYASPCLENLKTKKQIRTLKRKSNNLMCTQHETN